MGGHKVDRLQKIMPGKSLAQGKEQGNKKLNCCYKGNKGPGNS